MNPKNLEHQCASLRSVLTSASNDEIRACLEQAIKTLEWMQKGELVLKELMRLRKEEPELFEALRALIGMGAKLDVIREAA
jgi:hypothetical protein